MTPPDNQMPASNMEDLRHLHFDTLQKKFPHLHFGSGHDNSASHKVFDTWNIGMHTIVEQMTMAF